jgi:hypothetical protein
MKKSAKARLLAFSIVAILAAAFLTATALMRSLSGPQATASSAPSGDVNHADPKPVNLKREKALLAEGDGETPVYALPKVAPAVFTGDVRDLPQVPQREREGLELEGPPNLKQAQGSQKEEPNISLAPMPAPIQNFPGLSRTDTCTGGQCGAGIPPDPNGEVGPNHYVQAVNDAYAIYDKSNGNLLASFTENSLFSGGPTGTVCDTSSFGDPIVVYDAIADRWILSNFAFNTSGGNPVAPFFQCIAVSQTNNPVTGGWFLYAIRTDTGVAGQPPTNTLNDYPKFGIWTDCLYYSANGFLFPAGSFNGTAFGSFSRSDMYAGLPLTGALGFIANTSDPFTMIPSNLSAPGALGLPSAGTPNYFVSESEVAFAFEVRKFTAGTNCGGGGSLGAAANVSQTSYAVPGTDVLQPPPAAAANTLDSLGDRLMQKVQYRKVGSAESLWVVHSARVSATDRPQWAQLDVTGGTVAAAPVQQQIYAPDTTLNRWMGSIAADKDGNVAVGYSTSNATSPNFPSLAYSGRLAGDPINTLPQTETQLVAGAGSQVNSCGGTCHRWGDYSAISVDPADGCTFWYTNEYYVSQAGGNTGAWNTRIGSFKFPSCVGVIAPTATPTSTPTNAPTNTPTITPTQTPTNTPTITPTQTLTNTPSNTPTNTPTVTPTDTPTNTPSNTSTNTPSNTPSVTPTSTSTNTPTNTPSQTPSASPTRTPTVTSTSSPTRTPTKTSSNTPTRTLTKTPTNTKTVTPTRTLTKTPTITPTRTLTKTPTNTKTVTPTRTLTKTPTITPTRTLTKTPTNTKTITPTKTSTKTPTNTPTRTPTKTPTNTPTNTPT